jgi:hypothetical protein
MDYTIAKNKLVIHTDDPTAYASWVGWIVGKGGPAIGVEVKSEKTGKVIAR